MINFILIILSYSQNSNSRFYLIKICSMLVNISHLLEWNITKKKKRQVQNYLFNGRMSDILKVDPLLGGTSRITTSRRRSHIKGSSVLPSKIIYLNPSLTSVGNWVARLFHCQLHWTRTSLINNWVSDIRT